MKKRNILIISLFVLELIILIIDSKQKLAVHRILKYIDTGVLGQDINDKFNILWLIMLQVPGLYDYIDLIIPGILIIIFAFYLLGVFLKKDIIKKISGILNLVFIIIPFLFSIFYKDVYPKTVATYRMTLVGYLLILLPLFSMYILFLEGKKFNVQKFFNKKKTDYTKEIKELSDLCKEGVITQEEFERKKKELLDLK